MCYVGKCECLNTFWMRFESINEGQCGVNVRVNDAHLVAFEANVSVRSEGVDLSVEGG